MKAGDFLDTLIQNEFLFFTGVPCSYLAPLCELLNQKDHSIHVPVTREDIAVGLAAGAYLAGKMAVIYMQNSGLGYCLEAFASLHMIYYIPALVLVSYRGPEDIGLEEHEIMGKHTEGLLKTFNIQYATFRGVMTTEQIKTIKKNLVEQKLPYFVLITKDALE